MIHNYLKVKVLITFLAISLNSLFAQDIIAHWTFDEGVGDSAYDLSGNGNHMNLLNGVAWIDGLNGNALSFDGVDDKGLCAHKSIQTGMAELTIETVVWINSLPKDSHWGPIISKWGAGGIVDDAWGIDVDRLSPHGGHGVVVGKSSKHINGKVTIPTEKWIHFVFTWDGLNMFLYIDGNKVDSTPASLLGNINNSNTEIRLGHNTDPHFFNGKIDQITVYGKALSSQQVKNNHDIIFNNQQDPAIIAQWTFNEGVGDSAFDISGNGNHFKLLNGVAWVDAPNGKAVQFDGVDDKGLCVDKPNQTGMDALTIESVIWVEQHSETKWGPIVGKWGPGGSIDDAWALDIDRRSPYGGHGVVVGSGTNHINGSKAIPVQRWIHLVYTWENSKMAIYLNGRQVDLVTVANIGSIKDSDTEIRLGHNVDPHFFNGKIDQLTIYNIALHPDIIQDHFELLVGPSSEVNIGMKTNYAKPGEEVWLPVYLTNYEEKLSISSIEFSLNIDTSVIAFLEVSKDSGIAKEWLLSHNAMEDSIKFSVGGSGKTLSYGEGELIRCKFKVKSDLVNGAFSDLIPSDVSIDENSKIINTTTSGKITIKSIPVLYGDVSGNNDVTAYDGAGIVQYVLEKLPLPDKNFPNFTTEVADVSGDGVITSYDAALVFQYSVGLLDQFPVESNTYFKPITCLENYPLASFKLVVSSIGSNNIVKFDLIAENIKGALSADITMNYRPSIIDLALGGGITTDLHGKIETSLDPVKKLYTISFSTSDDMDINTSIKLASIEAVAKNLNSIEGGLFFADAMIDEELVMNLNPMEAMGSSNGIDSKTIQNRVMFHKTYLTLYNNNSLPGSFTLYDIRGRKLAYKQFDSSRKHITIDTGVLSAGMYIYHIAVGAKTIVDQIVIRR